MNGINRLLIATRASDVFAIRIALEAMKSVFQVDMRGADKRDKNIHHIWVDTKKTREELEDWLHIRKFRKKIEIYGVFERTPEEVLI